MKLINIVGARPQFIKVGPILRAIEEHNSTSSDIEIEEVLVHTGQHYDYEMSKVFFKELNLKEIKTKDVFIALRLPAFVL